MRILKCLLVIPLVSLFAAERIPAQARIDRFSCEEPFSLCTERQYNRSFDPEYYGKYIGHDEPSLLFYSNVKGSGNHYVSTLVASERSGDIPDRCEPERDGWPNGVEFPTASHGHGPGQMHVDTMRMARLQGIDVREKRSS